MALTAPDTAFPAWKHLEAQFSGRDPDGMQILALYLAAACRTREKYRMMCIPDEIFRDTMGCFSRFLREAKAVPAGSYLTVPFGHGGTSRAACSGWVRWNLNTEQPARMSPSHPVLARAPLCCRCISPLTPGFQTTRCPARTDRPMNFLLCTARHCVKAALPRAVLCGTWLLSPRCVRCCPRTPAFPVLAGIINIYAAYTDSESFYLWLFGGKKPLALLPRQTSLQRAVAAHLEQGGYIGSGYGIKK